MPKSNDKTSQQWFNDLVTETEDGLARYLRRYVSSPADVNGIMQDAYLKVYLALRKERAEGHAPKALLYTTAKNLAISRLRHAEVLRRTEGAVSVCEKLRVERPTVEQNVEESQQLNSLLRVVNQLPPKCREVFVLRWIHGLSQKAIAARLDIAVSTVEKHLASGLLRCRKLLASRSDGNSTDQRARNRAASLR